MLNDIKTIVWKEYKEVFSTQSGIKGNIISLVIFTIILVAYLPGVLGRSFVENPYVPFFYIWFPMFMVLSLVLDSFAGERERHTLETLLASRLSDHAILFGKIISAIVYGWGATVIFIIMGLIAVNIIYWNGQILLFPVNVLIFIILVTLLASVLVSSVGVLVSLRAPTVKLGMDTLVGVFIAVAAVPLIIYYIIPDEGKKLIINIIMGMGMTNFTVVIVGVLILIDIIILYLAMRNFRRSKLILV